MDGSSAVSSAMGYPELDQPLPRKVRAKPAASIAMAAFLAFVLLPVSFFPGLSLLSASRTSDLQRAGLNTQGWVSNLRIGSTRGGGSYYLVDYEYIDYAGHQQSGTQSISLAGYSNLTIGRSIEVRYLRYRTYFSVPEGMLLLLRPWTTFGFDVEITLGLLAIPLVISLPFYFMYCSQRYLARWGEAATAHLTDRSPYSVKGQPMMLMVYEFSAGGKSYKANRHVPASLASQAGIDVMVLFARRRPSYSAVYPLGFVDVIAPPPGAMIMVSEITKI